MSDNNLDDLILSEPESEGGSNRGLLVILGLVVLLLILGVVLANIIFGNTDDTNTTTEKVKEKTEKVVDSKKNTDKDIELIGLNNNDIDQDLAPIGEGNDFLDSNTNNDKQEKESSKVKEVAAIATAGAVAAATTARNNIKEKKVHIRQTPKPKPAVRIETETPKPKPVVHRKPKPRKETIRYGGSTYIQVGSFSRGPTEDFIDKIRRAGFKYRIKEVNGFRRVLVGPFRSASDAQRYLGTVRAKISSSAFIKR